MDAANVAPKKKKSRKEASVSEFHIWRLSLANFIFLKARPRVFWKANSRDLYLDELLRWEGRGDFIRDQHCPDCISRGSTEPSAPEFRCRDCFLPDLTCKICFIRRHRLNPFHTVEVRAHFFPQQQCLTLYPVALGWGLICSNYAQRRRPGHTPKPCWPQMSKSCALRPTSANNPYHWHS